MRDLVRADANRLTLVFESFAFKHGVPLDADYVFDVRILPNPFYIRELRPLTGATRVAEYLQAQPEAVEMLAQIEDLPAALAARLRGRPASYLTVAIGCTGGQHRSGISPRRWPGASTRALGTLVRHRELDARD